MYGKQYGEYAYWCWDVKGQINSDCIFSCLFLFFYSGHFSFSALLCHLASAVSLLTLSATIVDILILYILPNKSEYRSLVYKRFPSIEQYGGKEKNE